MAHPFPITIHISSNIKVVSVVGEFQSIDTGRLETERHVKCLEKAYVQQRI